MTCPVSPYLEREKLISELLMALERLLPKLTDKRQIKKVRHEIEYHKEMLKDAKSLAKR